MIDIARQVLVAYLKEGKKLSLAEIELQNTESIDTKGECFVTLYKGEKLVASIGNIYPIEGSLALEIIENTFKACETSLLKSEDLGNIKLRLDIITRNVINLAEFKKLNPKEDGVALIDKSFDTLAVILPNINEGIDSAEIFVKYAEKKLGKKIDDKTIIYSVGSEREEVRI